MTMVTPFQPPYFTKALVEYSSAIATTIRCHGNWHVLGFSDGTVRAISVVGSTRDSY